MLSLFDIIVDKQCYSFATGEFIQNFLAEMDECELQNMLCGPKQSCCIDSGQFTCKDNSRFFSYQGMNDFCINAPNAIVEHIF